MSDIILPNEPVSMPLKIDTEDHLALLILGLLASWARYHDEYITSINIKVEKEGGKKVFKSVNFEAEK